MNTVHLQKPIDLFVALPFRNGCIIAILISNGMNFFALCTVLVKIGPVKPVFMLLKITPFAVIRKKSAYHAIYLRITWTCLDLFGYFAGLVGVLVGMIIPMFVWRLPKEHCYGNQLNLGDVRRHHHE